MKSNVLKVAIYDIFLISIYNYILYYCYSMVEIGTVVAYLCVM